jgi:hypothetical protein
MTEATKNQNEAYRKEIVKLINQTEDTHILQCVYTVAHTHLQIANEKGGGANE